MSPVSPPFHDVAIVGAGAAGLATAIFAADARPGARIVVLDGARTLGAKILVSGGGRCNVTNAVVTERDFNGGSAAAIRRVLRAFPADRAAAWFRSLGVPLHEEAHGKLFPDSQRARSVLDALVGAARARAVEIRPAHRVETVTRAPDAFHVQTSVGALDARAVVLATGGLALPKSGSDGVGYRFAEALGHTIVPTTPALAPLLLDGDLHRRLQGLTHEVTLALTTAGARPRRIDGSLLWTHFGISGPAALDMSRHWLRAALDNGRTPSLALASQPFSSFENADRWLRDQGQRAPRALVTTTLGHPLPETLAAVLTEGSGVPRETTLAALTREHRRALAHALSELPLSVIGSRGYTYAEATAGGVTLGEVDPATMASRRCAGLFLVGEVLDVDGRLGGFNFQWAWSSALVAAQGVARASAA